MAGGTTEDVSQDPFEIFDPAIWVHWIVLETDGASRIRKLVLLR